MKTLILEKKCDRLFDLLPLNDEKGIFKEKINKKVFKRLKIEKGNSLDHWKVYVLNIHTHFCIVFKKGVVYEDDQRVYFSDSDTVALFIYQFDSEQKKDFLKEAILETNLRE